MADLKTGTSIFMQFGQVTLNGKQYSDGGYLVPKPANTLSFDIPASAIGMSLPITMHVVGQPVANSNEILFSVTGNYGSGIVIDSGGDTLTGVNGSFIATATIFAGGDKPSCGHGACQGDVYLQLVRGGSIIASGSWGNATIQIVAGAGVGGVTQPALASFHVATTDQLCASGPNAVSQVPLVITLAGPAPTGGTRVDLQVPSHAGLTDIPSSLTIPAGHTYAWWWADLTPGFSGIVDVTASAGGAFSTLDVDVGSSADCNPPASKPQYLAWVPPWLVGCVACSLFGTTNNEGDPVVTVNGALELIHDSTITVLSSKTFLHATAVGVDSISDTGIIAGRMTVNGVTQVFRADMLQGSHEPELLGQMVPEAINATGLIVGYRDDPTTGKHIPTYNSGSGVRDLALASPVGVVEARALRVSYDGQIVGTYTDNSGVIRGFRWVDGTTYTLPAIGNAPALPVAINDVDEMAVNSSTEAALISKTGVVTKLGVPDGYESFVVTSLNRYGYAVGTATPKPGAFVLPNAGFLWKPGTGFVPLSNYVKGLSVDDALHITDNNTVIVHGTAAGTTDLYIVTL
ncbi:MAG TPA: hypothetical protein VGG28_06825 [Kofleriaceae bacterium]